jgi:hypothetical protein
VPPCFSSVNVVVTPVVDSRPRIRNGLSDAQAGSEDPFGCGPWWSNSAVRSFALTVA